jgi:hypothetical protein
MINYDDGFCISEAEHRRQIFLDSKTAGKVMEILKVLSANKGSRLK